MIELLILALLALPIAAIVGVVMAIGTRSRLHALEWQLSRLERRLDGLSDSIAATTPRTPPAAQVEPIPGPAPDMPPAPRPTFEQMAPITPAPADASEEVGAPPPMQAPPSAPAPPATVSPAPPAMGLEERFGTQWVVWIGGLALALGGFFLVRYSIEQGLIGPAVRVTLGALLAIALIATGEWARRTARLSGLAGLPIADIPSILAAAGTSVAYADVYAAYALYGFLSPATAFVLLGLVALATLAAALLHGPMLAGLGLVGAYVTPLLVASNQPNYWSLYLYLAVVTAAAFALARMRLWRWLAVTAVAFAFLWAFPGIVGDGVDTLSPHVFHVAVGFALAAVLLVSGLLYGPPAEPSRIDPVSSGALAAFLIAAAILVLASRHDPLALGAFAALVVASAAIAWRAEAAAAAVPAAAICAAIVMVHWAVATDITHLIAPGGPAAGAVPEPARAEFGWHLVLGTGFSVLFAGAGFLAQGRSERAVVPVLWSASAAFTPIAILVALYYRIAGFDRSIPFHRLPCCWRRWPPTRRKRSIGARRAPASPPPARSSRPARWRRWRWR